ncbi:MAG: hypothetical protein MPJ25_01645 [Pirellulales bacterium]|nr:hypothetical protein [Pirellulales bacterium]
MKITIEEKENNVQGVPDIMVTIDGESIITTIPIPKRGNYHKAVFNQIKDYL